MDGRPHMLPLLAVAAGRPLSCVSMAPFCVLSVASQLGALSVPIAARGAPADSPPTRTKCWSLALAAQVRAASSPAAWQTVYSRWHSGSSGRAVGRVVGCHSFASAASPGPAPPAPADKQHSLAPSIQPRHQLAAGGFALAGVTARLTVASPLPPCSAVSHEQASGVQGSS